jgi:hypothetical protein
LAVPSVLSVGTRCSYFPYTVPAPTIANPVSPPQGGGAAALNNGPTITPSTVPPDIGPGGQALPAIALTVSGSSPDYIGSQFAVHTLSGAIVVRSAGFMNGQPLLSVASWTSAGSNPAQARWTMIDASS